MARDQIISLIKYTIFIIILVFRSTCHCTENQVNATKRVAIVTGANKGIGFEIVKGLCQKFQGDVYLTARDESRGLAAIQRLNRLGYKPKFFLLDVTDIERVKQLRDEVLHKYGGIDVLVNNAGIAFPDFTKTSRLQAGLSCPVLVSRQASMKFLVLMKNKDKPPSTTVPFVEQAEETLRVNFFSLLHNCNILFPILKPHARVVNLTSGRGHLKNVPSTTIRDVLASNDLTEEKLVRFVNYFIKAAKEDKIDEAGWPRNAYCMSKVAISALTRIQQRKLAYDKKRADLVVNHVHPGYVITDMSLHFGQYTPEQGAQSSIYAALLPVNTTIKGDLIWHDKTVANWFE